GGERLDRSIAGLVDHRREQEQIGRRISARELVLRDWTGAGDGGTERRLERIAFAPRAGAEKMRRNALLQDALQYRHEQGDVFAPVELAGIHHDQAIGRNAEPGLEPPTVAARGRKRVAVETAAQRDAAIPRRVTRVIRPRVAAHREGDAFEMSHQPTLEEIADHVRQGEAVVGNAIRHATAESALE